MSHILKFKILSNIADASLIVYTTHPVIFKNL